MLLRTLSNHAWKRLPSVSVRARSSPPHLVSLSFFNPSPSHTRISLSSSPSSLSPRFFSSTAANTNMEKIKKLRKQTLAALSDCKKALEESGGDMAKANKWLMDKGKAVSDLKSARPTAEGSMCVYTTPDRSRLSILELRSETAYVAKNDLFINTLANITAQAHDLMVGNPHVHVNEDGVKMLEVEALKGRQLKGEAISVGEAITKLVYTLGENCTLARAMVVEAQPGEFLSAYTHMGRVVGVIALHVGQADISSLPPIILEAGNHVAVQVASQPPKCIRRDSGHAGAKADEVLEEQVMIAGVEGKQTVKEFLDTLAKSQGLSHLRVTRFFFFNRGGEEAEE